MKTQSRRLIVLVTATLMAGVALGGPPPASSTAVATVEGKTISEADLSSAVGNRLERLRAEEYRIRRAALNELIARVLLEREAKARGISVADLLVSEVDDQVAPVSDALLEQAWGTAKGSIQQLPKEKGKAQIASMMREMALKQRREEYVSSLARRAHVAMLLEPPRLHVDDAAPYAQGDLSAPVTVLVFSDYQCPFCARAHTALRDAKLKYGKSIRLVYRQLPLAAIHPNAVKAAAAAECAGEQGAFWEMSERMFANQQALDAENLAGYAQALKLDQSKFSQCLDSPRIAAAVDADRTLASSYGIEGTPAIFVNGRWLLEPSFENIARTIDEELTHAAIPKPALETATGGGR